MVNIYPYLMISVTVQAVSSMGNPTDDWVSTKAARMGQTKKTREATWKAVTKTLDRTRPIMA